MDIAPERRPDPAWTDTTLVRSTVLSETLNVRRLALASGCGGVPLARDFRLADNEGGIYRARLHLGGMRDSAGEKERERNNKRGNVFARSGDSARARAGGFPVFETGREREGGLSLNFARQCGRLLRDRGICRSRKRARRAARPYDANKVE